MYYATNISALALLIIFCGWMSPQAAYAQWEAPAEADTLVIPLEHTKEVIERGQQIYTNQCAICHGEAGKGNGPAGAAFNPSPADLTSEEFHEQSEGAIFWKIREGRGAMPGFKNSLDEKKLWSIVYYIKALSEKE